MHRAFLSVHPATDRAAGCGTSCEMLSTYPVILEKVRGAERAVDDSGGGDEAVTVDSESVLSLPPLLQPSQSDREESDGIC